MKNIKTLGNVSANLISNLYDKDKTIFTGKIRFDRVLKIVDEDI